MLNSYNVYGITISTHTPIVIYISKSLINLRFV